MRASDGVRKPFAMQLAAREGGEVEREHHLVWSSQDDPVEQFMHVCYHVEIRYLPGTTELVFVHVREFDCETVALADSDMEMEARKYIELLRGYIPYSWITVKIVNDAREFGQGVGTGSSDVDKR